MANAIQKRTWRNRTKTRCIAAMRGKCVCCDYNVCDAALHFHHVDQGNKSATIAQMITRNARWQDIVVELRKCVLVCGNCHSEIHAGVREIPDDAAKFDETFADDLPVETIERCPACGKPRDPARKYCSVTCARRAAYIVDWDNVDLQTALASSSSIAALARRLGCSDQVIYKRMRTAGIHRIVVGSAVPMESR